MTSRLAALLACFLASRAAAAPVPRSGPASARSPKAAADEPDDDDKDSQTDEKDSQTFELGLRGYVTREANESGYEWGPTLDVELISSSKRSASRFKYSLELNYDDSLSELKEADAVHHTRVRATEIRYAKVHALQLFGYDLRKRLSLVPYVAGGFQYVDQRTDFEDEPSTAFYWSPTWAVGLELSLNKRLTLSLDYDRNAESGDRRVARFSAELKLDLARER